MAQPDKMTLMLDMVFKTNVFNTSALTIAVYFSMIKPECLWCHFYMVVLRFAITAALMCFCMPFYIMYFSKHCSALPRTVSNLLYKNYISHFLQDDLQDGLQK